MPLLKVVKLEFWLEESYNMQITNLGEPKPKNKKSELKENLPIKGQNFMSNHYLF